MIPYRYYGLILGVVFVPVGLIAVIGSLLGLVGLVGDGPAWQDLAGGVIGIAFTAVGVTGIQDYILKEERVKNRARRRRRPD